MDDAIRRCRRRPGSALGRTALLAAWAALAGASLAPAPTAAQTEDSEAAAYFRQSCTSCHTIGGGRLVGPDLKGVTERQDRAWLERFITEPSTVLASGDPYAAKLKQEANGAVMPPLPGMTREMAGRLLALIEAESALEKSQFAGLKITDEPFGPADVARGHRIFTGRARLTNGGPACVSCHTAYGLGGLGGGRLGPDLTKVYERMGGRQALASWLQAPATPTMRPVFAGTPLTDEEVLALTAYLETEARTRPGDDPGAGRLTFLLLGLGGAVLGLIAADAVWRKRLRGVRRLLLGGAR
ncbi:MAG TPA: c-type cytochrome [Thermoanaerobaculia bacterium]